MNIYSFDWATKKDLVCYDSKTDKSKKIPATIEAFEEFLNSLGGGRAMRRLGNPMTRMPSLPKAIFLFEMGGADSQKLMAFRAGHKVFCVPGKKIKDYRESLGLKKTDEGDAKLIYEYFKNNGNATVSLYENIGYKMLAIKNKQGGSASPGLRNSARIMPSPQENKGRGDIIAAVDENLIADLFPSAFYPFTESNADIAELKILFREHEDLKKEMVREKLKRIAFERRFKLAQVADDRIKKILFHKSASVIAKEKEVEQIKKILEKKVKSFSIWNEYLKDIKAVGPVIAAGLIGELGGRHFDSDESLKHYAGMVPKKNHSDYNRFIKVILFQFTEGIIKHRTPKWRNLYDNMKIYYQEKHEDWSKGKVNNYAKKFVQTKFLIEFWRKMKRESAND